ncbi:uncharacterized protein PGTG_12301 [Puccinia graminis f. sp. tritici CRL 75-36-700-3]|uniref:Zn(2)-C6 fungal-type domain-containing protein n=1 Tax=Puccinia graminis f. sp. tritici (strain CRL 75-36-700-3 / race SCCL) TaxID=418459 RepID=E3KPW0_PUCGT|nr:uncharacterized protein PGTG_12301 [Puccinia graminis f. sp. tritici CRL 75-36-700-3]EFP86345.2 hypothetical protein PGTG_12301 [Puccinia graminis f. sp. tritici CRL 75-36-700-3]
MSHQLPPNLAEDDLQAEHQPPVSSAPAHDLSIFIDPSNRFLPMPTRKKKRVYTSCRQCRKRRCACSRESPCFACVSRGEGDQCDWTGASPQFIKPKGQIHRDHFLSRQENPARLRIHQDLQALDTRLEYLTDLVKQHAPSSASAVNKPETVPVTNYHVDDIATQLSRFTLNQAIPQFPPERPLTNPNAQISIKEVEQYVEEEERKAKPVTFNIGSGNPLTTPDPNKENLVSSSATSPVLQGLLGIGKGPSSFEGIMAELPKCVQIKACLEQFEYHRAWMHRILHRPAFWDQVYVQIKHNFSYTDQRAQAHWLAILFSVCGLGLFNNVVQSEAALKAYELPTSVKAQRALALRWCRAATSCLEVGNFEEAPSVDSICAMAILAQLPLYTSNGETLGLALDFIAKAIDLSVKLDLHIDPDSHPTHQHSTDLVKQNRRRLMVALLCQHYKMGGLLCQEHGLRPLEQFSGLQLPLDQFDEDYDLANGQLKVPRAPGSTHTIMTGVRCRFQVSRIWQEIGIMFSNPADPPTHERVLDIHRKLKEVESKWPETIQTQFNPATCSFTPPFKLLPTSSPGRQVLLIDRLGCFAVFAAAMVRLHRGFLMEVDGAPIEDIKMHREQVYYYGRAMLAIHRAELFPLDNVPIQFFVLSSTISLAVYCLTNNLNDEEDKCQIVATELRKVKNVLRRCTAMSSILRRTYAVLDFALNKWEWMQNRTTPVDGGARKRGKTNPEANQQLPDLANFNQNRPDDRSTANPPEGNSFEGLTNGEHTSEESRDDDSLYRIFLQDLPLTDYLDFNHDLQHKSEPVATFATLPNFHGVPQSFDFGNLSQLHSLDTTAATTSTTHTSNGTKSDGSSVTYLSTPSSSTNPLLASMFNDQELNSSPTSLNPAATTFPFGVSFDKPQNTAPSFAELPYAATHQPAINSCNASSSVPVNVDSSLDASFTHNQLAGHNFSTAGYNLSNQFNLPVNSSIA